MCVCVYVRLFVYIYACIFVYMWICANTLFLLQCMICWQTSATSMSLIRAFCFIQALSASLSSSSLRCVDSSLHLSRSRFCQTPYCLFKTQKHSHIHIIINRIRVGKCRRGRDKNVYLHNTIYLASFKYIFVIFFSSHYLCAYSIMVFAFRNDRVVKSRY